MGTISDLISRSVLVGFLTAAGIAIGIHQWGNLLGIDVPEFNYLYQIVWYCLMHIKQVNPYSIFLGLGTWIVLHFIRSWRVQNKVYASTLVPGSDEAVRNEILQTLAKLSSFFAVLAGSIIARLIIAYGGHVIVVGHVPAGLHYPQLPVFSFSEAIRMLPSAATISFISFAGNWSLAKKYSLQLKYEVDATQELLASGLSTIVGVIFNSFVVGGGLGRSVINAEAGAQTQLSGIISATLILISVQWFTPLFYYIPMTVLGAVIQVAVYGMLDFPQIYSAYRIRPKDGYVMIFSFLSTIFIGESQGLFLGVFISLCVMIYTTAFPSVVHLGKLSDEEGGHFKNLERFKDAHQFPGVSIIRMDSTLFFGNAGHFKDMVLRSAEGEFHSHSDPIVKVVIDASCWIDIDYTAFKILGEVNSILSQKTRTDLVLASDSGIFMVLVTSNENIRISLDQCGLDEIPVVNNMQEALELNAIDWLQQDLLRQELQQEQKQQQPKEQKRGREDPSRIDEQKATMREGKVSHGLSAVSSIFARGAIPSLREMTSKYERVQHEEGVEEKDVEEDGTGVELTEIEKVHNPLASD